VLNNCLTPSALGEDDMSYSRILKEWLDQTKIYDRIHFKGKTDAEWNQKKALL